MLIKRVEQFLIVAVLVGQLCGNGWYFPGISVFPAYLLCLIVLGLLSLFILLYETKGVIVIKESFAKLALLLILDIIFVLILNRTLDVSRLMLIIFSFTFCLACTQAFRTQEEVNVLLKWYLLIVLISALIEIGQVFEVPFCAEIWKKLHVGNKGTEAIEAGRYLGLANDSLQFSYHLSAAFAIVLFIRFKRLNLLKKIVLFAIFFYALYTNATRSGLLALLAICGVWVLIRVRSVRTNKKYLRNILNTVAVLLAVIVLVFNFAELFAGTRFLSVEDASANSRIPMLLTAFNHALRYPFGMGAYKVQADLVVGANNTTFSYVMANTAHNLFGNCVASYGFIGLGLMLGLYGWAFCAFRKKRKSAGDPSIYLIAFCGLLGLTIGAFFHNGYILNGEISSFMFFAIMHTKCTNGNTTENRIGAMR